MPHRLSCFEQVRASRKVFVFTALPFLLFAILLPLFRSRWRLTTIRATLDLSEMLLDRESTDHERRFVSSRSSDIQECYALGTLGMQPPCGAS